MRYKLLAALVFISCGLQAQQVNPVPDYVFQNRMSVGRTTVTDTSAYFSIGPRFGATRGMQPPMVNDTAAVTGTKRNGLLIFSMQRNKYAYWDSAASRWREFGAGSLTSITAGTGLTGGTITTSGTIAADTLTVSTRAWRQKGIDSVNANVSLKVNISDTSSMLSPYVRAAGFGLIKSGQSLLVDSATMATRARVQKGIDSLGAVKGSGTVTSVSAGTGMSFTTITSTGAVAADTTVLSTRAWRQKGDDSLGALIGGKIGGSGTTNYIPKFTASSTLGNSLIYDNGTNVGIGTTSPQSDATYGGLTINGTNGSILTFRTGDANSGRIYTTGTDNLNIDGNGSASTNIIFRTGTGSTERARITSAGELLIGTTTDAGAYALQVAGSIYNTTGANLAVSSGVVKINTISNPSSGTVRLLVNNNNPENDAYIQMANGSGGGGAIGSKASGGFNFYTYTGAIGSETYTMSLVINSSGELIIGNNVADAGAYALQVAGSIYNTTGAVFAATSGNVGIGTTSPSERLHVSGKARITTIDSSSSPINLLWSNVDGVIQKTAVASVIGSGTAKYIPKFATATTFTNSLIYEDNNEVRINTTSDGGDWVLQVSGNTLISSGQLRVSANANAGMSLARSGTSEVFMETGNTSGGLKVGVAGSTGGSSQGFSGYAGFILTNPAYPLQFGSLDTMRMTLTTTGELLISTSTTDNGNYKLQVDGNVWSTGSLTTGDPTSGTKKPWKLGSKVATSVQLDTANYVEVEIDGVLVRLAIVTPL